MFKNEVIFLLYKIVYSKINIYVINTRGITTGGLGVAPLIIL